MILRKLSAKFWVLNLSRKMRLYSIAVESVSIGDLQVRRFFRAFNLHSIYFFMDASDPQRSVRILTCLPRILGAHIIMPPAELLVVQARLVNVAEFKKHKRMPELLFLQLPKHKLIQRVEKQKLEKARQKILANVMERIRDNEFLSAIFEKPKILRLPANDNELHRRLGYLGLSANSDWSTSIIPFRRQMIAVFGSRKKKHIEQDGKSGECPVCTKNLTSRRKQHFQRKHKEYYFKQYPLQCNTCDDRFINKTYKKRHICKGRILEVK